MQPPDVSGIVRAISENIADGRRVWVSGPVGSGRHTVARPLLHALDDARILELLALDDADIVT
jgi:type II secretory pathway predicted ATPase ExeA